jgi:hypothetical protein
VAVGLASRTPSEGVIQFVPVVFIFRTVLVDLGTENFIIGENLHHCHVAHHRSHMDCRGIESALLCTFEAKSSVTAHCSCIVGLRSIRDGAGVSVVFLELTREIWTASRSEATTASSCILSAALPSPNAVHCTVPVQRCPKRRRFALKFTNFSVQVYSIDFAKIWK